MAEEKKSPPPGSATRDWEWIPLHDPETKVKEHETAIIPEYQNLVAGLENATDPNEYFKALQNLFWAMQAEANKYARGGNSDLYNTFGEWENRSHGVFSRPTSEDIIKSGGNLSFRSNTLNNHHSPHGSGPWRGDKTDRINSEGFGEDVCDFIKERAGRFISAKMVDGRPEQMEPYSVRQVETTIKGYKQK